MYETGDAGIRDKDGRFQIAGRMDDIINIGAFLKKIKNKQNLAGHRISTAEIEDCIAAHPATSEAAVISIPHEIKGETTVAFVILKETTDVDFDSCKRDINKAVATEIAKFAMPCKLF